MQNSYAPAASRNSMFILLALAAVVAVVAILIGLSDKPKVDAIGITTGATDAVQAPAAQVSGDAAADDAMIDDAMVDDDTSTLAGQEDTSASLADSAEPTVEREIIVIPTPEPTPTPEVAAAVEPTPVPDGAGATGAVPSLPLTSGTVQGSFFTRSDENAGAVVAQNAISLSFAEDGSGAFSGVLDITYADTSRIVLNMSGPLEWGATNPQVETTLAGQFTLDAVITADDVTADDGDLSISSLEAGSGSLCISSTKCFGFTFPPQS